MTKGVLSVKLRFVSVFPDSQGEIQYEYEKNLTPASRAKSVSIIISEEINFPQVYLRLTFLYAELTNPVSFADVGVLRNHLSVESVSKAHTNRRKMPDVIIALVGVINNPNAVSTDNAKVLER